MRYRVRLDFLDASSFSVNSIYEAMVFFVGHQPVLAKKERRNVRLCRSVFRQMFFGGRKASCLATMIATMVYPFRKVSLVATSQALSFVRDSTKKTLLIPLEMKLVKLFLTFFFFLTVIIIAVFNYLPLSLLYSVFRPTLVKI